MWVWLQIGESPKKAYFHSHSQYLLDNHPIISTSVSMMASLRGSSEHNSQVGSKIVEKQINTTNRRFINWMRRLVRIGMID
jgi:hypothetical protein